MEQNKHIKNDDDVIIMKTTKRIMTSADSLCVLYYIISSN